MIVGGGTTVAGACGASVGAGVVGDEVSGVAAGDAGGTLGEGITGTGEGAYDVAPVAGSSVISGGVGTTRDVVFNKYEFASNATNISSAAPIPAIPIQRYLLSNGDVIVADAGVGVRLSRAPERSGVTRRGASDDGRDEDDSGGAPGGCAGIAVGATGCAVAGDTEEIEDVAGGASEGVDSTSGGCLSGVPPDEDEERTIATIRRNAMRRSSSCSATSTSARHTHGLSGHCAASVRNTTRAR